MTDNHGDDIRFVRAMAEAGRRAPLIGGRFYLFWGVLITVAYTFQWAVLDGRFGLPEWSLAVLWLTVGAIAAIGMPILSRSVRRKPGRGTVGNRVDQTVWTMSGFAIFAFVIGVLVATLVFDKPLWFWDFVVGVALTGYGVSLFTTGTIAGLVWMRIPAVISVAATGCIPILAGMAELYLFAATVVLAVAVVPGVVLMLGEPKSLPDEA